MPQHNKYWSAHLDGEPFPVTGGGRKFQVAKHRALWRHWHGNFERCKYTVE